MKTKSLTTMLGIATIFLFGSHQLGSRLMAQDGPCDTCSTPEAPSYSCIAGTPCHYNGTTPATQTCFGNCVSIYQCVPQTTYGSEQVYALGTCSSDGTACYGAVLVSTLPGVKINTAVQGSSCLQ